MRCARLLLVLGFASACGSAQPVATIGFEDIVPRRAMESPDFFGVHRHEVWTIGLCTSGADAHCTSDYLVTFDRIQ